MLQRCEEHYREVVAGPHKRRGYLPEYVTSLEYLADDHLPHCKRGEEIMAEAKKLRATAEFPAAVAVRKDYLKVRKDIAAIKALMPKVYHDIVSRALQLHGSLGVSNELPFTGMLISSYVMGLADGPTDVHKVTVARQILREYEPSKDLFPAYHLPRRRAEAITQYGELIERELANW